jgi:hypothetical protein
VKEHLGTGNGAGRAVRLLAILSVLLALDAFSVAARSQLTLPPGSTFGDLGPAVTSRIFRSADQAGVRSAESILGELMFGSPRVLGGLARDIGLSCDTCHTRGGSNSDFFIPGGSAHPGTFNGAKALFNPPAGSFPATAITIPSLFNITSRSNFGHDGRRDSLKSFLLDVIVKEFSGPSPKQAVLDSLTAYISDLERRPNRRLGAGGTLREPSDTERRGEVVFNEMGCAACHRPALGFADNELHRRGAEAKPLRTPSLLDHIAGRPYFHDGRTPCLSLAVREERERTGLASSPEDEAALLAYVSALQKTDTPAEPATVELFLKEIVDAEKGLLLSIAMGDPDVAAIAADGFAGKLQNLAIRFEDPLGDAERQPERTRALSAIADAALATFRLRSLAESENASGLAPAFSDVMEKVEAMSAPVREGQQYSLFNPERLKAYREKIGRP